MGGRSDDWECDGPIPERLRVWLVAGSGVREIILGVQSSTSRKTTRWLKYYEISAVAQI